MSKVQDKKDAGLATVIVTASVLFLGAAFATASAPADVIPVEQSAVHSSITPAETGGTFFVTSSGGAMTGK